MNHAQQIIETIKCSSVKRMLVVDDAFDPPELDPQFAGAFLDVLSAEGLRAHVSNDLLGEENLAAAVAALSKDDLDDEAVADALKTLYLVFVKTQAVSLDPGGVFSAVKGAALEALAPLIELLRCCGDTVQIETVGAKEKEAIAAFQQLIPHVIFMDFYISPPERTTVDISRGQLDGDRERSIKLLKRMLSDDENVSPAVVLISSQDVADRKDAYLGRLDNRVMGVRFGYLHKGWVKGTGEDLHASGDAADVLIDTSGSFEFGRRLESALAAWRIGAHDALEQLFRDLRDFDVKDFAYLLRFRLYDEGEPFADYLESFLGESLRALVDEKVAWTQSDFAMLNDRELTQSIEGAHPLPSVRVARFFHRMRFNSWETRQRRRFALGDLYLAQNGQRVRMVISPDCDLMPRQNGHAASRLLTIGGKIRGLQEDRAYAGDLIFNNAPKSIQWDLKDLMTHEFGDRSTLAVKDASFSFFATMRPMHAQAIQKLALADLSRVALAVPPAVNVGAPVRVFLKKKVNNRAQVIELDDLGNACAQVLMPRGGQDVQKRALFSQKFVRELLATLEQIKQEDLLDDHHEHWQECIGKPTDLRKTMLRDGLDLPGKGPFGITASIGKRRKKKFWLEIVIDVADEALVDLQGTVLLDQ